MSIEEVERIMDETQDAIEYQRVSQKHRTLYFPAGQLHFIKSDPELVSLQQIDEMLAGSLTQEDEDAVLAELEAITQVGPISITVSVFESSHVFKTEANVTSAAQMIPDRTLLCILLLILSCLWSLVPQGDVELPEVPSEELPEVPEASEEKPGLFCPPLN